MKAIYTILLGSLFAFSACTKEETPAKGGDPVNEGDPVPTADYYFQADINGSNLLIEDSKSDYAANAGSQDDGNIKRTYATLSNNADNNSLEFLVIGDLGKSNPSNLEVYNLFNTGTQSFSNRTSNGVLVNWKDENGNIWTSDTRFGSPNNSSIVFDTVGQFIGGSAGFKVTGTITCRVFDLSGDFKTIESGTFSLRFDASK